MISMDQTPQSQLKLLLAKGEQGYLTYAEVNDHLQIWSIPIRSKILSRW